MARTCCRRPVPWCRVSVPGSGGSLESGAEPGVPGTLGQLWGVGLGEGGGLPRDRKSWRSLESGSSHSLAPRGAPHCSPAARSPYPPSTHVQGLQLPLRLALELSHHLEEGRAHHALCFLLSEGFPVQQLRLQGSRQSLAEGLLGGLTCLVLHPEICSTLLRTSGETLTAVEMVVAVAWCCVLSPPYLTEHTPPPPRCSQQPDSDRGGNRGPTK